MKRRFMSGNEIPDNQVWYTSSDGNIIDIIAVPEYGGTIAEYGLGSIVISNQYYDKGIIKTSGPVTQIGQSAFRGKTSLVSITLPRQVAVIYDSAFDGCTSLSQIDLKNITTIGNDAFYYCKSLKSITIPNSVTSIGSYAFANCDSLTSITIPDSVTTIGNDAFYSCSNLSSVTIGDSVTTIGDWAFQYCSSLTSVYCMATTPPALGSSVFDYNGSGRKIYVPAESVEAYKSAEYWSKYADAIVGYNF